MSGPPFNYADVSFRVTIDGDGRKDRYVLRPINPATSAAWSPPVALDVQSPMYRSTQLFTAGGGYVITAAGINGILPYAGSYVAIVPPITSTNAKTMKGVTGDVGIPLIPNEALILALPNPLPNSWALFMTLTATEMLDIYVW